MSQNRSTLGGPIVRQALKESVLKLDPRVMVRNPVMFVVEIGFAVTLLLAVVPDAFGAARRPGSTSSSPRSCW